GSTVDNNLDHCWPSVLSFSCCRNVHANCLNNCPDNSWANTVNVLISAPGFCFANNFIWRSLTCCNNTCHCCNDWPIHSCSFQVLNSCKEAHTNCMASSIAYLLFYEFS